MEYTQGSVWTDTRFKGTGMRWINLLVLPALLAASSLSMAEPPKGVRLTPLDEYVHAPDPAYKWELVNTVEGADFKTYIIKLTSQGWRTEADVNRVVWEHWLIATAPKEIKTNKAFIMVAGGSNDKGPPTGADAITMAMAKETGSVVAELKMVPNQPLIFNNDGKPRVEDDLIGYAWAKYLETGDPTWLPRLPMVKSVIRAMDCMQEAAMKFSEGRFSIEKFVIAGGSKRGWTTWMSGPTDTRIEAIVPIVIDVANCDASLRHHCQVYGFWATAIGNYYEHQILQRFDHPRMKELYAVVDPYSYLDRLTLPKFVVNASGDQFFCPDSSQFYYDDLKGEKLLRYVPNADHSLKNSDAVQSIIAYYQTIISGKKRPVPTWEFLPDGSIRVSSDVKPTKVTLWQANNPKARDFRLEKIGPAFKDSDLKANGDGTFTAKVETPKEGWTAAFVELSYDVGGTQPLKTSTAVRILPDVLPFKGIDPKTVKYEKELTAK